MRYELLEHTADAKFRAYGKTKDEAFAHAVEAMTAIVVSPKELAQGKTHVIIVQAENLNRLLFNMLDELLFLLDTEKFIAATADVKITEHDGKFTLNATLKGDDARKWPCNLKAVTYSEMIVEEKEGKWTLQAVIDI